MRETKIFSILLLFHPPNQIDPKETFLSSITQIDGLPPIKNFLFFFFFASAINLTILSQVEDQNLSNYPMNPENANPNSLHKLNANFATHAPLLMNNATTT